MDLGKQQLMISRVGFIGSGNMAQAIGEGLIKTGLVPVSNIIVSAPSTTNFGPWQELGVKTVQNNGQVIEESDIVFLAVKPHFLDAALKNALFVNPNGLGSKLFISLLGGVTIDVLQQKLRKGFGEARVVRAMPNTPMLVGEGCSVFCCGDTTVIEDEAVVKRLLSSAGVCEMVPESLINAIGGVAGSGPAYIYMVIEAMSDGAVKQGVPRAMAMRFAAQTVLGAAKMVLQTGRHPGQLKDEVCSPGGSTIQGMHALERAGVRCAFMDAIEAAAKKSAEVGEKK